jgi:hypothetical protein
MPIFLLNSRRLCFRIILAFSVDEPLKSCRQLEMIRRSRYSIRGYF